MSRYSTILNRLMARLTLSTVLIIFGPIFVIVLWLRIFGLPEMAKSYILSEIERRHVLPCPVAVDRLLLDPTGAVLAKRLTVYRDASRQRILIQVDQVRIGIAWLSWWRGRGFFDSASVSNAQVSLPINADSTIDLHEVNADVTLDGHDIRVENAQARFLNIAIFLRGTIHNDGQLSGSAPTQEQLRSRQQMLEVVTRRLEEIGTESPLEAQFEFEVYTHNLAGGRANLDIEAHNFTWRTAPIQDAILHASLHDGVASLDDFRINLSRGELTAYGEWNFAEHNALFQFNSSLDFTLLNPAFTGPLQQTLLRLDFPDSPPSVSGRVLMDLENGFKANVQADLDWYNFTFNGRPFSHLNIPIAYDGKRLLIPEMVLEGEPGRVKLKLYWDKTKDIPSLEGKVTSTLDPTVLRGVFGQGMDNFLSSCDFKTGGPMIEASAAGTDLKTDAWSIKGKLATNKFSYKAVEFFNANSDFTFVDSKLNLPNLKVHRMEGDATGSLIYDFKNRQVQLDDVVANLNIPEVAPVLGPKFTQYTQPYHFADPPTVHAKGIVDLQSEKKDLETNLVVNLQAQSNMQWTLFGIPYVYKNPEGTLTFKNRSMTVEMTKCGFYEGNMVGKIDIDMRQSPANFDLNLTLDKVNFQQFMIRSFGYKDSKGLMNLQTHLTGAIGPMETLAGTGEVKISDGDIYEIPFLGTLTPLIPGFSTADAAHGHFTISQGNVLTDDLNISSETFALIGTGKYNFIQDHLDLNMRVNANSVFGVILYPVSKIFEYNGSGPMKNTKWVPKNF